MSFATEPRSTAITWMRYAPTAVATMRRRASNRRSENGQVRETLLEGVRAADRGLRDALIDQELRALSSTRAEGFRSGLVRVQLSVEPGRQHVRATHRGLRDALVDAELGGGEPDRAAGRCQGAHRNPRQRAVGRAQHPGRRRADRHSDRVAGNLHPGAQALDGLPHEEARAPLSAEEDAPGGAVRADGEVTPERPAAEHVDLNLTARLAAADLHHVAAARDRVERAIVLGELPGAAGPPRPGAGRGVHPDEGALRGRDRDP